MTLLDKTGIHLPGTPAPGERLLEARQVSVVFDGRHVVVDVDLAVRSGEVLALVGPNGAGKSTLLGTLAGDIPVDAGQVLVHGRPLGDWSADDLAVRRGVLLQQTGVSFPFTVTQIVRMGRAPWAGTAAEDWDEIVVADAISDTDMSAFTTRVYMSLSGGERSRAALARVLAQEPGALLLDEPTSSLDIRHQEMVLDVVRARAGRGDGVVVVLHDLGLAGAYADTVAVMSNGRIVASGSPEDVLTPSLLSDVYEHPIDVFRHPGTDGLVVVPWRIR